jgi:hypothetical protein
VPNKMLMEVYHLKQEVVLCRKKVKDSVIRGGNLNKCGITSIAPQSPSNSNRVTIMLSSLDCVRPACQVSLSIMSVKFMAPEHKSSKCELLDRCNERYVTTVSSR